jgi:hypothetical protein
MEGVIEHDELSAEDKAYVDHVERWMWERGVDLICAACKASSWVAMHLMAVPATDMNQQLHQSDEGRLTSHILAPLCCANCGYVVHFNALLMGLPLDTVIIADGAAGPS